MDCIFCNIATKKITTPLLFEDENIIAFNDISPKAPVHILVIPKKHIATINDVSPTESQLIGDMVQVAKRLAQEKGVAEAGYRLIFNCNQDGGQAVYHIHLHLLAGRDLTWPPG